MCILYILKWNSERNDFKSPNVQCHMSNEALTYNVTCLMRFCVTFYLLPIYHVYHAFIMFIYHNITTCVMYSALNDDTIQLQKYLVQCPVHHHHPVPSTSASPSSGDSGI